MKAGIHNTIGGAIRMVISVATVPFIIRLVGLEEYGLWALVSAVVGLIVLVEGGLSISTTVFVSRDLSQKDDVGLAQTLTVTLGGMIALASSASLILWLGADAFSGFFPNLSVPQREATAMALRLSAVVVWVRLVQQVPAGVEQACQSYGVLNIIATGQQVFGSLGLLWVAWLGGRTVAFMKWQALIGALTLLAHLIAAGRLLGARRLKPRWNRERVREIGRYSLMTWTSSLGTVLFSQCDRLIIGTLLNTSALGIYSAITNITAQVNVLSALPVQPLLPLVSQIRSRDDRLSAEGMGHLRQAIQLNTVVALGSGATLCLFAPEIVALFIQGAGVESVLLFRLATVIYTLYSMNAAGYYILLGSGAVGLCMKIVFLVGFVTVLAIACGASWFGLPGGVVGNMGYIGTLSLTLVGLKRLNISSAEWGRWIGFPLGWFGVMTPAGFLLDGTLLLRLSIFAVGAGVLIFWWIGGNRKVAWITLGRQT